MPETASSRRQFFRGAGVAAGSIAGLGLDLAPVAAATARLKIEGAREVASVCPYCAVGCGQIVSVRDRQIVNIEGNPDSPINEGTLCPKGSATFQLAVNPNRLTTVRYRAPFAAQWEEKPLDWAMDRIAERMKATAMRISARPGTAGTTRATRSRSGSTIATPSPPWAGRRWTTSGTTPT
jgi:formate dehydrogenase major subunit